MYVQAYIQAKDFRSHFVSYDCSTPLRSKEWFFVFTLFNGEMIWKNGFLF